MPVNTSAAAERRGQHGVVMANPLDARQDGPQRVARAICSAVGDQRPGRRTQVRQATDALAAGVDQAAEPDAHRAEVQRRVHERG